MTKAKRAMTEDIKLVDLVIELLDARAPLSSMNPDIKKMAQGRGRLLILNKADLADENETRKWTEHFRASGLTAISLDSRNKKTLKQVNEAVNAACREKIESNKRKGILNRPLRAMVAGIPNVGKSTFINSYAGKAAAKTGNKPGVTRGKQWIRLNKELELLDTPGILWPKIEDPEAGFRLACLGTINDNVINREEMVSRLLLLLRCSHSFDLSSYGIDKETTAAELLSTAALKKNLLKKGGEPDIERAETLILTDFRSGKLGRITLDSIKDI